MNRHGQIACHVGRRRKEKTCGDAGPGHTTTDMDDCCPLSQPQPATCLILIRGPSVQCS